VTICRKLRRKPSPQLSCCRAGLLDLHCERQSWTDEDLHDPINVYQLALRAGTSFEATVWTLHRYDVFDRATAKAMAAPQRLKKIKQDILCGFEPDNYRGDVWLVTDHDAALHLEGGPGDIVVVRLPEHSGAPASAAGSNMPWEQPLNQILESIQGPVAKVLSVIIIIITGLTLAFGETSGGFRRLIQIVFGLSIAFAASSFFLSFFQFGGGVLV
jgi:type IV secretion system protein TrbC